MLPRAVPPVHSPVSPAALGRALADGLLSPDAVQRAASDAVAAHYQIDVGALTDSGTSALVLALRIAAKGSAVAMPGYACIDLIAAARQARTPVLLYDLDPLTLSPDLASLRSALEQGARTVVLVHLFGFPVDVDGVRALAEVHGATIIDDAAQGIGGSYGGKPLGSLGHLGVVSFGRGKGVNAAGGGALLASASYLEEARRQGAMLAATPPNVISLAVAGAQWALGRPSLYSIPLSIPSLRLGEMIYEPAHEPRALSPTSASLLPEALSSGALAAANRRAVADRLRARLLAAGVSVSSVAPGSVPGALRLPVLLAANRGSAMRLGALRPYPIALGDHQASSNAVLNDSAATPGARELALRLFSLPTHEQMEAADEDRLVRWAVEGHPEDREG